MDALNDIRKKLFINSAITYAMAAIAVISLLINYSITSKAIDESRRYLYMIRTNGEIVPLEWRERRDNIEIELKSHVKTFVDCFYNLNKDSKDDNIKKALELGDFKDLYADRINKNYFNQIYLDVRYTGNMEHIEVEPLDDTHYSFKIIIDASAISGDNIRKSKIFATGKVEVLDRSRFDANAYLTNPHGMLIYDYIEEKIVNIENE